MRILNNQEIYHSCGRYAILNLNIVYLFISIISSKNNICLVYVVAESSLIIYTQEMYGFTCFLVVIRERSAVADPLSLKRQNIL